MSLPQIVEMIIGYGVDGFLNQKVFTRAEDPSAFFQKAIMTFLEMERQEEWAHLWIIPEDDVKTHIIRRIEGNKFSYIVNDNKVTKVTIGRGRDGLKNQQWYAPDNEHRSALAMMLISFISMGSVFETHMWIDTDTGGTIHLVRMWEGKGKINYRKE